MPPASDYPVQLDVVTPEKLARWRVLQAFLAIPHFIVLYFLQIAAEVVTIIAWFAILFTGRFPQGMWGFSLGVQRWQWRAYSYALFLHDKYPPFELPTAPLDPATEPALFAVAWPTEPRNRLTTFFRIILVIPHLIVLYVLYIAGLVVVIIAWFVVLFTGHWPDGMRNFMVGANRWYHRALAYVGLLVDEYPPFTLQP